MTLAYWFKAADTGDQAFVKRNLYQFVNQRDSQGNTALMRACMAGYAALLPLLQEELTKQNEYSRTALMVAVFSASAAALIPHLMREARFHDACGQTALMIAAQQGAIAALKLLKDSEYGERDNKGRTALMHAAAHGQSQAVEELAGLEKCAQDANGMTALMFAAGGGHLDICKQLARHESNIRNAMHETALQIAQMKNRGDVIAYLSEFETDVEGAAAKGKILRSSEKNDFSEQGKRDLKRKLEAAQQRAEQLTAVENDARYGEQLSKVSGDLLALNLRIYQAEVRIQQLRSGSIESVVDSRLSILDKRIEELDALVNANHQAAYDANQKTKYSVQGIQFAQAELQAQLDDARSQVKLAAQNTAFLRARIENSSTQPQELDPMQQIARLQTYLAAKAERIELLENTVQAYDSALQEVQKRLARLETDRLAAGPANLSSDACGRSDAQSERQQLGAMQAKLQENLNMMQELISNYQTLTDGSIMREVGKIKVDLLALQHQQYIAESYGYDGRLSVLEKTVKTIQEFVYGALAKPQ